MEKYLMMLIHKWSSIYSSHSLAILNRLYDYNQIPWFESFWTPIFHHLIALLFLQIAWKFVGYFYKQPPGHRSIIGDDTKSLNKRTKLHWG